MRLNKIKLEIELLVLGSNAFGDLVIILLRGHHRSSENTLMKTLGALTYKTKNKNFELRPTGGSVPELNEPLRYLHITNCK